MHDHRRHPARLLRPALALMAALLLGACTSSGGAASPDATTGSTGAALRTPGQPSEYVGFTATTPSDPATTDHLLSGLVGPDARAGRFITDAPLGNGLFVTSSADAHSADQVVLTVSMDTVTGATPTRRVVARVPASFSSGSTFIDAVDAAFAQQAKVAAAGPGGLEPWRLELRSTSAVGGHVTVAVDATPTGSSVVVTAQGPTTSLVPGSVNQPSFQGKPYETIYGLVNFHVSRDQFDFFVHRAYGISAGSAQNFKDFELVPHNWLRLTVTPKLDQDVVDVGFDVMTKDGRRVPLAKAPASLKAGEQFMQQVFRMMDTQAAQEAAKPGSSTGWQAPFYYDDPDGGGVVQVIATGNAGQTTIAYAVESPVHELTEVDPVDYQGTVEKPAAAATAKTCAELGTTDASSGRMQVTFTVSSTIKAHPPTKGPLRGHVWGSVYRAEDVKITGPIGGAEPMASFSFDGVDVTGAPGPAYDIATDLPAGDYQILGFMDIDGNAPPAKPGPDKGDPVIIPIGGYHVFCASQPVVAEFAILLP